MANKSKNGKTDLKPEKDQPINIGDLVQDERTQKIAGTFFLLLSFLSSIAFISYMITWKEDQDLVMSNGISMLVSTEAGTAANWLGNMGAYFSHQFFYNLFGLASFLFCNWFFVIGVNGVFARRVFSISRNSRYIIVGLLFFSTLFSYLSGRNHFPWGGKIGDITSDWLVTMLGNLGTALLLFVSGFAYFIWRFNPVFTVPKMPRKKENPVVPPIAASLPVLDQLSAEPVLEINVPEEEPRKKGKKGLKEELQKSYEMKLVVKEPVQENIAEQEDERPSAEKIRQNLLREAEEQALEEKKKQDEEKTGALTLEPVIISPPANTVPQSLPIHQVEHKPEEELIVADPLPLEIITKGEPLADEPLTTDKALKMEPYEPTLDLRDYKYPGLDLLESYGGDKIIQDNTELESNKNQIMTTLKNYDISIQKITATIGPTVTLYEIVPAPGVRISRIKNLEDDIALSLAALGIRIIAPIPGKGTIGIEVPNVKKSMVSMKALLSSEKFQHNKFSLPIAIGKKIDNENYIVDLAAMPHLLMAGATGQGKSVGLNAILVSLLYKKHPSQLKLVLVDPKKVELSLYRCIERHFLAKLPGEDEAIITDTKKVVHTLNALCIEMDNRYDLLKEAGARNIKEYNEKFVERRLNPQKGHQFLPFIVLVIDEFADLIMTAGKEIEMPIGRLAQLARAVGIHLIIATQRPSVNIITGTIKANFPARIAFKVSSKVDSRTILDTGGAEQLIGKGDLLISNAGEVTRLQCVFVDTPEVERICDFIGEQRGYPQAFLLPEFVDEKELEGRALDPGDRDILFEDAARLIVQNKIGSTSLIQRKMKLGYNRAGRLMDQLEAAGVVGPNQGSKPREVLYKSEFELEEFLFNKP
jgi:S-DNA-T family DNA segregation ATPase FtsK/SpoIIIE